MKRKMNTRSRKALSPVVASIILIAVTVAVSIAVAAWMGALTFNFMATEQGQVTNLTFTANSIAATLQNTGTTPITIQEAWVNGVKQTVGTLPVTVPGNNQTTVTITYTVVNGAQYEVKLVSAKGNTFVRTMTAPT
jgi:archaeal type IV pilus assembly protein PilA